MTGKRQAAHAAGSGHRAAAAGRPALSIERVRRRLDVETGRFLFDDGRTLPRCRSRGKPNATAGSRAWPLPAGMPDRI